MPGVDAVISQNTLKSNFISLNEEFFYAQFNFLIVYDFPAQPSGVNVFGNWDSLPINKKKIKIEQFFVTRDKRIRYVSGATAVDFWTNLIVLPDFWEYCSIGIGSRDCSLITPPGPFAIQQFYECNYLTYEMSITQVMTEHWIANAALYELQTQQNFINCAFLVNTEPSQAFDFTNWQVTNTAFYAAYTPAGATFDSLRDHFCVHIHGRCK